MDFSQVLSDIKTAKLAGRRYEIGRRGKFRDLITVRRDGALFFERYNYGESAGIVYKMQAAALGDDDEILWNYDSTNYTDKYDAPKKLTGYQDGALYFDEKSVPWNRQADLKRMQGMGFFKMLFGG